MRSLVACILVLLATPVWAQLNTVEDIDAAINAEFVPQWTNGGSSGFREAMRDSCENPDLYYNNRPHCGQCVFRDDLHELPIIVLGAAALPSTDSLPNRDDAPVTRPWMTCKLLFLSIDPGTSQPYVDPSGLSRGIRFTAKEYGSVDGGPTVGWWLEVGYLWSAADDGTADGYRCRRAGEGPHNHTANWAECPMPGE